MSYEEMFNEGMSPNFEEYLQRLDNGTATKADHDEFYMRLMQRFCINVYDDKPVEPWILRAFADAFTKILMGGDWNDEIYLPWIPMSEIRSRGSPAIVMI